MHHQASLIQPVLTFSQLLESDARYVIGTGELALHLLEELPDAIRLGLTLVGDEVNGRCQGYPIIDFRTFCACAPREAAVLYATDDDRLLLSLTAVGQAIIYDARDYIISGYRRDSSAAGAKQNLAVISTVPRSGTYRIIYFLITLNELLGNPNKPPCSHKLYLHYVSSWAAQRSAYRLRDTFGFLGAQEFRIGHHIPPGALAAFKRNPAMTALLKHRADRFARACVRHTELAGISHTLRPWLFEPQVPYRCAYRIRYTLVIRNIVDQLTSLLTLYELLVLKCLDRHPRHWTLREYVAHCNERLRSSVFFSLDGQIPLLLQKSIVNQVMFTDIVIAEGYLDSLITDYAVQLYGCLRLERQTDPDHDSRVFHYHDMMGDAAEFFIALTTFLRGAPLSQEEQQLVAQAAAHTDKVATSRMERALGHALSYRPGLEAVFEMQTHMTDHPANRMEIRDRRAAVEQQLRQRTEAIQQRLENILKELRAAEPAD